MGYSERSDQAARLCAAQSVLRHWAHYVDPNHLWPPHLSRIEKLLTYEVEPGQGRRVIVTMPPRHGKSEVISGKFPSWYIGRNPDRRVILTSHTASLAIDYSARNRDYLIAYGSEVFGCTVDLKRSASEDWRIRGRRGGIRAAGVGGSITGRGADLLIMDDPFKDYREAHSKTVRDHVWNWWTAVALTRLEPGGSIVVISTRWHADDLIGRILDTAKRTGEQWTIIDLPALAEENDPLGRAAGEPLWPARFGRETLLQMRETMGSYMFDALYQQQPTRHGGSIFTRSWFRYYRDAGGYYELLTPNGVKRVSKRDCWLFQTVDPAATERDTSDYFACGTWAVTPESDLLLVDMFRERLETPKHRTLMQALYHRYEPALQGVEKSTFGLSLIQEIAKLGLPVVPLDADRDKIARAYPIAARYETGSVYHREGAPWLQDYEDELQDFPRGAHDDQVDVAGYAAAVLSASKAHELDPAAVAVLRGLKVHA